MNPGDKYSRDASMKRFACSFEILPTAMIVSPVIPMSPTNGMPPVPSKIVAPWITISNEEDAVRPMPGAALKTTAAFPADLMNLRRSIFSVMTVF